MDQTPITPSGAESQVESVSDELVAALNLDHPADDVSTEEVNSEGAEDNQPAADTETTDTAEAPPTEDKTAPSEPVVDGDKKEAVPEPTDSKEPESKKEDLAKVEFLIAGKKHDSLESAIEAVNSISGVNTQMAGQINELTQKTKDKDQMIADLQKQLADWEEHYKSDDDTKKPEQTNVADHVRKVLQEERTKDEQAKLTAQYQTELAELPKERDYTFVLPVMEDLATKLGDKVRSISPKELFRMARGIVRGDDQAETLKIAEEMNKEKTDKEANKSQAKKIIGGNAKKSPSIMRDNEVSPEVAAVLGLD